MVVVAQAVAPARPGLIPRNSVRALFCPWLWLATVHLTLDVVVAASLALMLGCCVALSAGLTAIALLGVPLWIVTTRLLYRAARFERARFRLTLGVEITLSQLPARTGGVLRDAVVLAKSRAVWRQLAYCVLLVPLSIVNGCGVLLAWSVPPAFVVLPIYYSAVAWPPASRFTDGSVEVWVACSSAVAWLLFVSPQIIRGLAHLDVALARTLLGPSARGELSARVDELVTSRRRVVDSAQEERRRIERDLHDGAQQRLVALAMTLGRARSRLAADADPQTRELLDEAHREAKQAITELRDLTRGLHPPVLTDRGLDAALSAVAARAPLPVHVDIDAQPRPSATAEAIAYFVVTEALTNIAKHAEATRASVVVRRVGLQLRVSVMDDGVGGADASLGSGLAGLSDRISGVDGRFDLVSPSGGPTVLIAEIPCVS